MNGVSRIRAFLVRLRSILPSDLRTYFHPFIYGLVGGLSAVAFQISTQALFRWLWIEPSRSLGLAFIPISLALSQLFSLATHLPPNEQLALTVAGMSACLGAVVRAPITSILIVFEMTHQFAFARCSCSAP
jgi:Voltage gated chloride channel